PPEDPVHAHGGGVPREPHYRDHEQEAQEHPDHGREHNEDHDLLDPRPHQHPGAGGGERRTDQPPNEGVGRRHRQPVVPGNQIPDDRPGQRGDHHQVGHGRGIDDPLADGGGHVHAQPERRHEVEEGGPYHRHPARQHAGGDDGGNRVG